MNLIHSLKFVVTGLLALSLTGCASIVDGSSAHVSVTTDPADARVTVFDRAGEAVESQQTPALFSLKRGAGYFRGAEYRLVIQKDGYAKTELNLTTTVNGWYFANLFFGGLIGLIIVDPATGAMYSLSPKNVSLVLEKRSALIHTSHDGLIVMLRKDVPEEFASRLVQIPVQ